MHVDNSNDALGLAFTDLINSFGVKQNVATHCFNHMLDLIISHGIDLTDIDIVPQIDDVTDHFLVSCMLRITVINYMALCYHPGRTIVPATKDRFTNNLPDLSQLLCVPINTHELDEMTSNMGTIFSNTLEAVAPLKLKKVREKHTAPWYNSYITASKPTTCLLYPVPTKLLNELLPVAEEPFLNIINSSLSLGHVPKPFKLAVIKPLIKNHN